jgi:hypothetical protein
MAQSWLERIAVRGFRLAAFRGNRNTGHLEALVVSAADPQGGGAWTTAAGLDGLIAVAIKVNSTGTLAVGADPGGPVMGCAPTCVVIGGLNGLTPVALKVGADGTVATSGGGGGVASFSGDGTIVTNAASMGAVSLTIAGTSGGIPYFNSSSSWASSAALTNHAIVTGGGAGAAPTIGNGDFTIDSTAHTLKAGAAGLVDLSAEASGGLRIPNVAFGSIGTPAAGSLVWNNSNGNPLFSNGAALIWVAWAGPAGSGSTTCSSGNQLQYLVSLSATGGPTCQSLAGTSGLTSQKNESATDANVLTLTPNANAGSYRLRFVLSVSAANAAVFGWTATWTDSNGNAQTPTNLTLTQAGSALPALTFTASAAGNYYGQADIDINNAAANIVIKFTLTGGTITAKATATIERVI